MKSIEYMPIGIIHSPYEESRGTPIQAQATSEIEGRAEIFPEYVKGLKDLGDFSHAYFLYHFHLSKKAGLLQVPFLDDSERGIFSIRSPSRPNPIGLSVVEIVSIENGMIIFRGVDILDGTPLLDIKPYVPQFDCVDASKIGWLKGKVAGMPEKKDDGRFTG
jgi:tRNA-Thr(GGU) m(6)t(6)A37 methyltransferase TsaA